MTDIKKKTFEELTPEDCKELKITFAPGSFDGFEGTQEELNELIAEITEMIRSGEILEKSNNVDIDEMLESDDPEDREIAEKLLRSLSDTEPRNLQ